MYVVRDKIMIISFTNSMRGNNIKLFSNTMQSYKSDIAEKSIKGVFIDISSVVGEANIKDDLALLVKHIVSLNKKLDVRIAIGEYSVKIYKILRALTKNTSILLFKNLNVAKLFFTPKSFKKELRILIFDEEEDNMDKLGKELARFGYTAVRAKDPADFQDQARQHKNDILITCSSLNQSCNANASKKLCITRKLVENLPVFMDSAVETMVMLTGLHAKKNFHSIKQFKPYSTRDIVVAMMSFKGDLNGKFILIFPRKLALIAIGAMLGEKIDGESVGEILDGVGEFCNIITGSAKSTLQRKNVKVVFDLPKAYTSIQAVSAIVGQSNGLWIDMQLEDRPFYMFISS